MAELHSNASSPQFTTAAIKLEDAEPDWTPVARVAHCRCAFREGDASRTQEAQMVIGIASDDNWTSSQH